MQCVRVGKSVITYFCWSHTHVQTHATIFVSPALRTEIPLTRRTVRLSTVIPFSLHDEKSEWDLVYPGSHTTLMTLNPTQPEDACIAYMGV